MKYSIGIDIGGTNTKLGIVDEKGNVLTRHEFKTTDYPDFATYMQGLETAIKFLMSKQDGECLGIGIGAPNGNYYKGTIDYAPNLPFGLCAPIVETLRGSFNLKHIYLSNDANAAAVGEKIYGGGKNLDHFIVITLGTGLGSGIIIDGKLLLGVDGFAGELGHVCAVPNGRICGCGKRGCLEAYASATALIRQTKAAMQQNKQSIMWQLCDNDLDNVTGITAFEAMRKGDPTAKQVVDKYIYYISVGIVDNIYVFQPEVICLGGGISGEGDNLIAPIIENVKNQIPSFNPQIDTKIKIAELGNDAGIIGAAYI
jgi:glucokinase